MFREIREVKSEKIGYKEEEKLNKFKKIQPETKLTDEEVDVFWKEVFLSLEA